MDSARDVQGCGKFKPQQIKVVFMFGCSSFESRRFPPSVSFRYCVDADWRSSGFPPASCDKWIS